MNQQSTPDRSPERIQEIRAEIATVLRQVEMTEHRATLLPSTSFGVSNAVTAADWHERVTWLVSVLKKADAQVEADAAQIATLTSERNAFRDEANALRRNYLAETRDLAGRVDQAEASLARVRALLTELTVLVRGECPSLLNEDSGGDARLSMAIDQALSLSSSPSTEAPQHVCGLEGYNGMIDPPCPGCEARSTETEKA